MKIFARAAVNERLALQCAIGVFALVPIAVGLAGMVQGQAMITNSVDSFSLDSHFRYLSGILFGIGLCFWILIPRISTAAAPFRLLTFLVFIGGLSRLAGVIIIGWPAPSMIFGLAMELIVTPALCLWQARVASNTQNIM